MAGAVQFWGLGSGLSNIGDMVDAMLITDKFKLQGYEDKNKVLKAKKEAWIDIEKSLDKLDDTIKNLSGVDKTNFLSATLNKENFVSATTTSSAITGKYSLEVKQLAEKHTIAGIKFSDIKTALNVEGSFKLNGANITISKTDSLSSIMRKINSSVDSDGKSTGVKANIIDGTLFIENSQSGSSNQLHIEDSDGVLKSLGMFNDLGEINTVKKGTDAIININGVDIVRESNKIDDAIQGVTLSLTNTTKEPLVLEVKNDTEATTTLVTDFVKDINALLDKLNKYDMYNAEAKTKGALNGDSSVDTIENSIRKVFQIDYKGSFSRTFEVGISIDRNGKINLDEKKLKDAINASPDGVINLFTKGLDTSGATDKKEMGLFGELKKSIDYLVNGKDNLIDIKKGTIDDQTKTYNGLIERQKAFIDARRAMLESEFRAMEQIMSSMNNQTGFLGANAMASMPK